MKKGLNLNVAGYPADGVVRLTEMDRVGVCPASLPYIKPKLAVKIKDRVKQGSRLFSDKRHPAIGFSSPGGGTVEAIDFGPRRIIRAITIRLDKEEQKQSFGAVTPQQLAVMSREELARHLMAGGLWPLVRALPFRDMADPAVTPPAVIVNLDTLDLFHPGPGLYLKDALDPFFFGLDALNRLAPEVYLVTCHDTEDLAPALTRAVTHRVAGRYPADDPGVFLYYNRASSAANRCWYIHGRDVLMLGRFLFSGFYPVERLVTVATPGSTRQVLTRQGAPLSLLAPDIQDRKTNAAVAGGIWRGRAVGPADYLGLYDAAVTVLPAGNQSQFFGFLRPGWRKPSRSRTFLSALNRGPFPLDAGLHGEKRACVNCGACAKVCPVNILPQFTIKSVLAGEIEEALAHGLLDCVECGLCTYVCPSKIELNHILHQARETYYLEQTAADTP